MFLANLCMFSAVKFKVTMATFGGLRQICAIALRLTSYFPCMVFAPAMHYSGQGYLYQIWCIWNILKQFDFWLTPDDPCMTFSPTNALHSSQGFFLPNMPAIGHSWVIWPLADPRQPCVTFDNALDFGQGLFLPNLVVIGHFCLPNDLWPWSGCCEKLTTNNRDPFLTTLPNFSPRSIKALQKA